ncbi:type I-C CRISPR-associated protein Cas8c/Csd1 [Haloferula chungangensis]|uniref:Type I-C CRISPR-associated protein Cas8c/Csd1 n=1 Tax=Haloferula chungangensis TaxID=1048331 RepID=A0ABW2L9L6_9BACT
MILNSLSDLYTRLADDSDYEIAKPGYSPQNISFRVVLKPDGSLFAIQDARIKDAKGKLRSSRELVIGEAKPPGAGINPGLLWDNTTYMLGYKKDDPKPERTEQSFEAFRERHLALENEIAHPHFSSVCRFLENWSPEKAAEYVDAHPEIDELTTGFGLFSIQGESKPVNEQREILDWWDMREPASDSTLGQCLITGASGKPIARLHPKIKSVAGAQSAGASLVSFNAPAYESYGKDQSFNAPVSEKAAFQYGTALNALLSGKQSAKHRIRIGDTTCVFWTDKKSIVEDTFGIFATEGSNAATQAQDPDLRSKIELFLKQLRSGSQPDDDLDVNPSETQFFLLGLAPNAARLSVRFFHRSTVKELIENLRAHHRDIAIVREWEETKGKRLPDPEFPAYWQLLAQTARVSDEISPLLGGSLMRAILQNTAYPEALYSAVIRRIRADREVNYLRAAIIKGILTRNHNQTIATMLDTENTDPAYLLGRLFAALEKTQTDALGELNSGLRDKFYSSASATPASVYPRILRTYQHHLAKLTGGHKINRERLVQEILDGIPATGFPSNFNLKSQGIFALGYYHQRKDFFTKKDTSDSNAS